MNTQSSFSAGTNKLAYAQAFSASQKRHTGGLRGRLHDASARRRTSRRTKV